MKFLLDTNIISDAVRPEPSASLAAWMSEQEDQTLFISPLTLAEIRRGILEKPAGGAATDSRHGSPAPKARRLCLLTASLRSTGMPA